MKMMSKKYYNIFYGWGDLVNQTPAIPEIGHDEVVYTIALPKLPNYINDGVLNFKESQIKDPSNIDWELLSPTERIDLFKSVFTDEVVVTIKPKNDE